MQITVETNDLSPALRERLVYKQTQDARRARDAEFARLLRANDPAAAEQFTAATDYDRAKLILAVGGDEFVEWLRDKPALHALALAAHANPAVLQRQLLTDDQIDRWVRIWHREDPRGALPAQDLRDGFTKVNAPARYPITTAARYVTAKEARAIQRAGVKVKQHDASAGYGSGAGSSRWKYDGASIESADAWRADAWASLLEGDRELAAAVERGDVIVEELPADYGRFVGSMPKVTA